MAQMTNIVNSTETELLLNFDRFDNKL